VNDGAIIDFDRRFGELVKSRSEAERHERSLLAVAEHIEVRLSHENGRRQAGTVQFELGFRDSECHF
jgi:hypothetical protein